MTTDADETATEKDREWCRPRATRSRVRARAAGSRAARAGTTRATCRRRAETARPSVPHRGASQRGALARGLVFDLDVDEPQNAAHEAHVCATVARDHVAVTNRRARKHAALAEPHAALVGAHRATLLAPATIPQVEETEERAVVRDDGEPPERMAVDRAEDGVHERHERRGREEEAHDEQPRALRPHAAVLPLEGPHVVNVARVIDPRESPAKSTSRTPREELRERSRGTRREDVTRAQNGSPASARR